MNGSVKVCLNYFLPTVKMSGSRGACLQQTTKRRNSPNHTETETWIHSALFRPDILNHIWAASATYRSTRGGSVGGQELPGFLPVCRGVDIEH